MRRTFLVLLCTFVIIGAGCFGASTKKIDPITDQRVSSLSYESTDAYVPSDALPSPAPEERLPEDSSLKDGEISSESNHVILSSIIPNQVLENPFVILGRARSFDNSISWRVRDQRNAVLARGSAMTNAESVHSYGAFRVRAFFDSAPETDTGFVDVFTISPRDGSEQDMVSIPVRFASRRIPVKVFFSNIIKDPSSSECDRVYPETRRVVETLEMVEASIAELIKGPSTLEQSRGARTSIIPGTSLRGITVVDGVAGVDFSREFVYALSGPCQVRAVIAQVHETLKQFPSIEVVNILVEGELADLQPQAATQP